MRVRGFERLAFALAAILVPATLVNAALSKPTEGSGHASLVGQLLVASPEMGDPRFHRTVILMVRHTRTGAFGIVINRPVGERSVASLLAALGEKDEGIGGSVRVFAGGPVQPEIGFVIHSADYQRAGTLDIDGRVAMTATREILLDIAHKKGPDKSLVAFGYAGWGPGQLEGELQRRSWFTASQDPQLIFDQDRDKLWDDAMARRTQDL